MANWAIIIGINQYEDLNSDQQLRFAVRDAEKMKEFLCDRAGFPPENVLLCSDNSPSVENISTRPTFRNLRRILREKIREKIPEDHQVNTLWFFFAGHGFNKNNQDYFLPKDGNPGDEETAIKIRFVVDCLRKCPARNIILVLDMCRDNRPIQGSRGIGTETTKITEQQQDIITIFSCHPGHNSYEIEELEQGAFTHTLLNGLQQNLNLKDLDNYLNKQVPAVNYRFNKPEQKPSIITKPTSRYHLPLLPSCTTPADINNYVLLAQDAELEEGDLEKALTIWRFVEEASLSEQTTQKARNAIRRIQIKLIFIFPLRCLQITLRYLETIWNRKQWKYLLLAVIIVMAILPIHKPLNTFIKTVFNHECIITQLIPSPPNIKQRFSWGENRLIDIGTKDDKQAGINAFKKQSYREAIEKFESYLAPKQNQNYPGKLIYKNDPEALIYFNNAKLRQAKRETLKIAVSVPISHKEDRYSVDIAKEILRGVAQAQNDINSTKQLIGGKGLEVEIIDDENDPKIIKPIAEEVVQSKVLAVVGHNTGDASLAGGKIYQGKIVMISPTTLINFSKYNYSGKNSYIFRASPSVESMANLLVTHIRQKLSKSNEKPRIAICFDPKAPDQISFKEELEKVLGSHELINSNCEFQNIPDQIEAEKIVKKIRQQGANSLLLAPRINNIGAASKVAHANANRNTETPPLMLFSSPSLYIEKIVKESGAAVNNLVLAGSWHPDAYRTKNPLKIESNPWNLPVNWRTAMAYDATCAIIEGLKHSDGTREGLQKALRSDGFSADGAGEKVKFDHNTGERKLAPILVQVQPDTNNNYKFKHILPGE